MVNNISYNDIVDPSLYTSYRSSFDLHSCTRRHMTPQVVLITHSTIVCESLKLKNNVLMRANMTEKGKQIKHGSSRKRWLGAYSGLLLEHWALLSAACDRARWQLLPYCFRKDQTRFSLAIPFHSARRKKK